ncbi:MAG: hypothetical protein JW801_00450 [Bacteroidales bacterium]|nr:hypothetical protein [Bacteroidales bacterium]
MPYRRLPNTDAARLKALKQAFTIGRELPPFKLAFSQSTFQRVQSFLPSFEKAMRETKEAYQNQVKKNKDYLRVLKKAKLYISHFIQVVNMAIMRGDLPENERKFFGMREDLNKLPLLNAESDIIKWGEKLIHGENLRKAKALSPITNPTIAVVRVRYEQFLDAYKYQKTLQKNYHRSQEQLAGIRKQADDIIVSVWNEVEEHYNALPDNEKRESAEAYGLSYVFRKNEIQQNLSMPNADS